jgi:porin
MRLALAAAAFVLAVLGAPAPGPAQPVAVPDTWGGDFWSRPRLTGSWGDVRDELDR